MTTLKQKTLASHAEESMTQSWFNEHFENSELDLQSFSKWWLFQASLYLFFINKKTFYSFIRVCIVKIVFDFVSS